MPARFQIPTDNWNDAASGRGQAGLPCVVCGKAIEHPTYEVECVDGSTSWCVIPGTADVSDAGYMGYHPVGVGCLRKHPELKPYAVRVK